MERLSRGSAPGRSRHASRSHSPVLLSTVILLPPRMWLRQPKRPKRQPQRLSPCHRFRISRRDRQQASGLKSGSARPGRNCGSELLFGSLKIHKLTVKEDHTRNRSSVPHTTPGSPPFLWSYYWLHPPAWRIGILTQRDWRWIRRNGAAEAAIRQALTLSPGDQLIQLSPAESHGSAAHTNWRCFTEADETLAQIRPRAAASRRYRAPALGPSSQPWPQFPAPGPQFPAPGPQFPAPGPSSSPRLRRFSHPAFVPCSVRTPPPRDCG
jgi:hypothetical protein